jgi:hypothetical protein
MNKSLVVLGVALSMIGVAACSSDVRQEERAMITAQKYYEQLVAGNYEGFVEGTINSQDSLPADYKEQLVLNAKMYVERMQNEHQGIRSVKAMRAQVDTLKASNSDEIAAITARAYVALGFADSTKEEVLVPMVLKNDVWYLR